MIPLKTNSSAEELANEIAKKNSVPRTRQGHGRVRRQRGRNRSINKRGKTNARNPIKDQKQELSPSKNSVQSKPAQSPLAKNSLLGAVFSQNNETKDVRTAPSLLRAASGHHSRGSAKTMQKEEVMSNDHDNISEKESTSEIRHKLNASSPKTRATSRGVVCQNIDKTQAHTVPSLLRAVADLKSRGNISTIQEEEHMKPNDSNNMHAKRNSIDTINSNHLSPKARTPTKQKRRIRRNPRAVMVASTPNAVNKKTSHQKPGDDVLVQSNSMARLQISEDVRRTHKRNILVRSPDEKSQSEMLNFSNLSFIEEDSNDAADIEEQENVPVQRKQQNAFSKVNTGDRKTLTEPESTCKALEAVRLSDESDQDIRSLEGDEESDVSHSGSSTSQSTFVTHDDNHTLYTNDTSFSCYDEESTIDSRRKKDIHWIMMSRMKNEIRSLGFNEMQSLAFVSKFKEKITQRLEEVVEVAEQFVSDTDDEEEDTEEECKTLDGTYSGDAGEKSLFKKISSPVFPPNIRRGRFQASLSKKRGKLSYNASTGSMGAQPSFSFSEPGDYDFKDGFEENETDGKMIISIPESDSIKSNNSHFQTLEKYQVEEKMENNKASDTATIHESFDFSNSYTYLSRGASSTGFGSDNESSRFLLGRSSSLSQDKYLQSATSNDINDRECDDSVSVQGFRFDVEASKNVNIPETHYSRTKTADTADLNKSLDVSSVSPTLHNSNEEEFRDISARSSDTTTRSVGNVNHSHISEEKIDSAEINNRIDQVLREIISSSSGCDDVKKSESDHRGNNQLNSDNYVINPVDSSSAILQQTTNSAKSKNIPCCGSGNKTEKMNNNSDAGTSEDKNIEEAKSRKNEFCKGRSKREASTKDRLDDKYGVINPNLSTNLSSDFTSDSSSSVASVSSGDSLSDCSHSILTSDVSESDDDASYYLDDEPITVKRIFESVVALFTDSQPENSNEVKIFNEQSKQNEAKLKTKSVDNTSRVNEKNCEPVESVGENVSLDMMTYQDKGKDEKRFVSNSPVSAFTLYCEKNKQVVNLNHSELTESPSSAKTTSDQTDIIISENTERDALCSDSFIKQHQEGTKVADESDLSLSAKNVAASETEVSPNNSAILKEKQLKLIQDLYNQNINGSWSGESDVSHKFIMAEFLLSNSSEAENDPRIVEATIQRIKERALSQINNTEDKACREGTLSTVDSTAVNSLAKQKIFIEEIGQSLPQGVSVHSDGDNLVCSNSTASTTCIVKSDITGRACDGVRLEEEGKPLAQASILSDDDHVPSPHSNVSTNCVIKYNSNDRDCGSFHFEEKEKALPQLSVLSDGGDITSLGLNASTSCDCNTSHTVSKNANFKDNSNGNDDGKVDVAKTLDVQYISRAEVGINNASEPPTMTVDTKDHSEVTNLNVSEIFFRDDDSSCVSTPTNVMLNQFKWENEHVISFRESQDSQNEALKESLCRIEGRASSRNSKCRNGLESTDKNYLSDEIIDDTEKLQASIDRISQMIISTQSISEKTSLTNQDMMGASTPSISEKMPLPNQDEIGASFCSDTTQEFYSASVEKIESFCSETNQIFYSASMEKIESFREMIGASFCNDTNKEFDAASMEEIKTLRDDYSIGHSPSLANRSSCSTPTRVMLTEFRMLNDEGSSISESELQETLERVSMAHKLAESKAKTAAKDDEMVLGVGSLDQTDDGKFTDEAGNKRLQFNWDNFTVGSERSRCSTPTNILISEYQMLRDDTVSFTESEIQGTLDRISMAKELSKLEQKKTQENSQNDCDDGLPGEPDSGLPLWVDMIEDTKSETSRCSTPTNVMVSEFRMLIDEDKSFAESELQETLDRIETKCRENESRNVIQKPEDILDPNSSVEGSDARPIKKKNLNHRTKGWGLKDPNKLPEALTKLQENSMMLFNKDKRKTAMASPMAAEAPSLLQMSNLMSTDHKKKPSLKKTKNNKIGLEKAKNDGQINSSRSLLQASKTSKLKLKKMTTVAIPKTGTKKGTKKKKMTSRLKKQDKEDKMKSKLGSISEKENEMETEVERSGSETKEECNEALIDNELETLNRSAGGDKLEECMLNYKQEYDEGLDNEVDNTFDDYCESNFINEAATDNTFEENRNRKEDSKHARRKKKKKLNKKKKKGNKNSNEANKKKEQDYKTIPGRKDEADMIFEEFFNSKEFQVVLDRFGNNFDAFFRSWDKLDERSEVDLLETR